jgi:hypothetical protein
MLRTGGVLRAGSASALLALLLAVVSWHTAMNLGGVPAARGYGIGCVVVALVVLPVATRLVSRAPTWVLPSVVVVCVAALVAIFVLGFPPAYSGAMGVGSDRANALNVAVSRLADGLYPYDGTTYVGNPISPLPGALLMAASFVWLTGDAAWQNVAWLLLLLPLLNRGWRLRPRPTLLWGFAVIGGLEVLRECVIGDDLVSGAVPALAAVAWTLAAARSGSTAGLVGAGAVLGVATCTRPHMVLVLVVAVAAVGVASGWRRAGVVGVSASFAWVALVVPFLSAGLTRFSPLHVAAKVTGTRGITVGIVVTALVAAALLVVALALVRPSSERSVGWICAAILFTPSVLSLGRWLFAGPPWDLDLTLGAGAVPFALWAMTARSSTEAPRHGLEQGEGELAPDVGVSARGPGLSAGS